MRRSAAISLLTLVPLVTGTSAGVTENPGSLDPTFGQNGVMVTDLGGIDSGNAVVVGTRIVAAGTLQIGLCCDDWRQDLALVGYLLDGTVDPSFGDGGVVITDIDQLDRPVDMQLDREGRILVLLSVGDSTDTSGAVLARYLSDGAPDTSFGDGGLVDVGTDLVPKRIALQSDGKIVVAAQTPIVLTRYMPDGQPDPGFGENGRVVTSLGTPNDWPIGLAVLPDGKLLVIARTALLNREGDAGEFNLALVRYRQRGSLDSSFGDDGIVRRKIRDWYDVMDGDVTASGRIVVLVSGGGGGSYCATSYDGQSLWRFRQDGQPDTTFDGNGRARLTTLNVRRIALQAHGRILVAGEGCFNPDDPEFDLAFSLARYRADGSLDGRFGTDGTVVSLIDGRFAVPHELVLQSNDRVLVVGNTITSSLMEDNLAIARYIAA